MSHEVAPKQQVDAVANRAQGNNQAVGAVAQFRDRDVDAHDIGRVRVAPCLVYHPRVAIIQRQPLPDGRADGGVGGSGVDQRERVEALLAAWRTKSDADCEAAGIEFLDPNAEIEDPFWRALISGMGW